MGLRTLPCYSKDPSPGTQGLWVELESLGVSQMGLELVGITAQSTPYHSHFTDEKTEAQIEPVSTQCFIAGLGGGKA